MSLSDERYVANRRALAGGQDLLGVLEKIAAKQEEALGIIERNGFVFRDLGHEPGNWQHLAFTLYMQICEMASLARAALAEDE